MLISLFFSCLLFLVFTIKKKSNYSFRYSIVFSLVILTFFVAASTELLSAYNAISSPAIQITWSIYFLASCILFLKNRKKKKIQFLPKHFYSADKLLLFAIFIILFFSFVICIVAYPNNWDSMTYHLTRVMHWIQNKNVNHYPTAIDRQISQPPLAEYFILHFYLLSGSDRTANLVQYLFMCGSLISVSLIAKELGAKKRVQLVAAFFAATIPMGILQSNSTQNDYAVSFFIVTSVLFLIKVFHNPASWKNHIAFSACIAFALLTKGTAYIYLVPVGLIYPVIVVWKLKLGAVKYFTICIFVIFIFNSSYYYRNYYTYKEIVPENYGLKNDAYGIAPMLSNISKNAAMHLRTPFSELNKNIENIVYKFNGIIGVDVNDPKLNWQFSPAFFVGNTSTQEDSAGNLLHIILLTLCFFILVFRRKKFTISIFIFSILILSMFCLFCFILKWQIWNCRLHLPVFVLSCVLLAAVVEKFSVRIQWALIFLFFIYSLPFLFYNQSRPLIGNKNIFYKNSYNQYFFNNEKLQKPFFDMSAIIIRGNLKNVGWIVSGDAWEYPMWVLLKNETGLRMEHIAVQNASAKYESTQLNDFIPDGIILTRFEPDSLKQIQYKNETYQLVYQNDVWKFLERIKK